jgi:hypothetical protein
MAARSEHCLRQSVANPGALRRLALLLIPLLAVSACTSDYGRGKVSYDLDNRLNQRLAPDIAAGRVTVNQVDDTTMVALADQSLFTPGRAELNDAGRNVLTGVMQALLNPRLLRIEVAHPVGTLPAARTQVVQQYFSEANLEATPQPDASANGLVIAVTVIASQPGVTDSKPTAASAPVSFDGRYDGAVQVTGVVAGGNPRQCAVDTHLSLLVTANAFSYTQSHPGMANTAPGLNAAATTVTYSATIGPDGAIRGDSGTMGGAIEGVVSGTHMNGTINGLACYYSFTADRI